VDHVSPISCLSFSHGLNQQRFIVGQQALGSMVAYPAVLTAWHHERKWPHELCRKLEGTCERNDLPQRKIYLGLCKDSRMMAAYAV
jgi:hypothetical protein